MESLPLIRLLPYLQHKYLTNTVAVLVVLLICFQLANITWGLVPNNDGQPSNWQPTNSSVTQESKKPLGMAELINRHIFGDNKKVVQVSRPVTRNTEAQVTPLSVNLTGILASSEPKAGLAIIESRGKQGTYGISETIDGTQATIEEVLSDRVILKNNGKSEYLMLDGAENIETKQVNRSQVKPVTKKKGRKKLKDKVAELRGDPGKLTDYLRISPVRKDGEMQGYRLNPGKERLFFTEFDLKPNDLAVSFNGLDLKDSAQAMSVMKELSNLTEATITVERDGQLQDIFIQLP